MPQESHDIFQHGIIDYYHHIPSSMESYTLFSFAANVNIVKLSSQKIPSHQNILKNPFQHNIAKLKLKPCAIRIPPFTLDDSDYFYSLLLLHLPHRNENELLLVNDHVLSPKNALRQNIVNWIPQVCHSHGLVRILKHKYSVFV